MTPSGIYPLDVSHISKHVAWFSHPGIPPIPLNVEVDPPSVCWKTSDALRSPRHLALAGTAPDRRPPSLEEAAHTLRGQAIDTVISVNVLERIPDDRGTLRTMWEILPEGGQVILFVPALPWLYGSLDRTFQHVWRYQRHELHEKVAAAGFWILSTRSMNFPGMVAWLVSGRIVRRRTLDPWAGKLYDRYAIPIIAKLERLHPHQ